MMRDFIKEQLRKSLDFYQTLYEQKEASGHVVSRINQIHLQAAYDFLSRGSSYLHLYQDAFDEYLHDDDNNKYFKAALTNDLNEIVLHYFKKNKNGFFDSSSRRVLSKLDTSLTSLLNKSYDEILKLISVSLPGVSIDKHEFPAYLFALESTTKMPEAGEIILILYDCLLKKLNYEILKPLFFAEDSFSRAKDYHRHTLFQRTGHGRAVEVTEDDQSETGSYLNKWSRGTVALLDWKRYPNSEVVEEFGKKDMPMDEKLSTRHLENSLFEEAVLDRAHFFCNRFDHISSEPEKSELAERDLKLIADLIEGQINEVQTSRLQSVFDITMRKQLSVQIDALLHRKLHSSCYSNIQNADCLLDAKVLIHYKRHLEAYLKKDEKEGPKELTATKILPVKTKELASFQYIQVDHGRAILKAPEKAREKFEKLLNLLKEHQMVSPQTTLPQFKRIFSGEKVEKPVLWVGCRGDLKGFIQQLTDKKKVKDLNQQHWKVADKCFVIEVEEKDAKGGRKRTVKRLKEIKIKSQKVTRNHALIAGMVAIL